MIRFIIAFFLLLCSVASPGQEVPYPLNNYGVYEFLDELANDQIISINSAIKPYSRLFIANCLKRAEEKRDQLSTRQQKELDFYMLDFRKEMNGGTGQWYNGATVQWLNGKREREGGRAKRRSGSAVKLRRDLFYYKDSLFSLTINPIIGGELFTNSAGEATYWRNGAEARGYVQRWGFYASLRDNHEKPLLGLPTYLTQRKGGHIKGSTDWSDMQGGITYSWKWGNAGLVKDEISWGNNYNGANIFGGNNPSFIQLRLHLNPVKWFNFDYFHGWLNSMVVDSAKSFWVTNSDGPDYREKYHRKYIAANMFTFTPLKFLNISVGNSIIYDDSNVNPAYIVPLFFYKSVDHSVSSGIDNMNSQMFFDISSRQIRHLHLYATLFVDELSVSRFTKKDEWNFFSWKAGFRLSNFPIKDLSLTSEFTYTYPLTFQHYVPTLTFESNGYNLGHYLRDNSREWYVALDYRPIRTMDIKLFFIDAIRGPDYTDLGTPRLGNPPLDSINWHNTSIGFRASYQVINDLYVWASFVYSDVSGDVRWSPEYFFGKKNTFNLGITFGF
ncbi:MAG: hypothetical protein NT092_11330 [Bacteroidia bacterium]|nr:hypothetical protein [Bacteroidia bacterium]